MANVGIMGAGAGLSGVRFPSDALKKGLSL